MLSERIEKLKDICMDYNNSKQYIAVQDVAFTPDPDRSAVMRHADAFCAVMDQMNTNYIPGSRLAGNGGDKFLSRPQHLIDSDFDKMRDYPKDTPRETIESLKEEIFYIWPFSDGHISPGFKDFLKKGINGIIKQLDDRMKDDTLTEKQSGFLKAARQQWQAVKRLEMRYADFFEELALNAETDEEKREYKITADTIRKVPAQPATTFREAIQSLYFTHMCIQFDDVSNHSFGRLDQYLYPYYKKDIDEGVITHEEAEDLFYEFWLKYTPGYLKSKTDGKRAEGQGFVKKNDPENGITWMTLKCISHVRHLDDGQTMDLGGYTKDGKDAINAISWMALNALDQFRTIEPKPTVKYTKIMDPKFIDKCYLLLSQGLSHPAITFPDNGMKGFRQYDGYYKEEDLSNYCHIGCVELGIEGKSYTDPMNAFINLPKILLITMQGGALGDKKIGLQQEPPKTYEEFKKNYYAQIDYFIDLYVKETNRANPFYAQFFFRPVISTMEEGCIESATLVDEGGSTYWTKCINCCGMATAGDSLYAIKKLVYEDVEFSLAEFNDILASNYDNNELLRKRIENKLPKYGNGIDEVDSIAAGMVAQYCDKVRRCKTYIGSPYRPGVYSFYETINRMGSKTPATPNGRKAKTRFSLNAGPDHGVIKNGATSVLKSLTKFSQCMADNACPVDLQLSGGTPPEIIKNIVEYLANHDALFVQTMVANKEDLIKAEERPENYKDLMVRVTGFSANYVALDARTRKEILARSDWN